MPKRPAGIVLGLLTALSVFGCGDEQPRADVQPPAELTREAIGYYCNMIVKDHLGPKAQIFLHGRSEPLWFSSVRDALAFTLLPEEPKNIAAIYVNDMGRASWDSPENDTWIEARDAWFVIDSNKVGGMGAAEAVPFTEKSAARTFASLHGGQVTGFSDLPPAAILSAAPNAPSVTARTHAADIDQGAAGGRVDAESRQDHAAMHGEHARP